MKHFIRKFTIFATLAASNLAIATASAQGFGGPIPPALPGSPDLRATVTSILSQVLNFLALLAAVVIVIAGIRLIISQGEEEQKEKAKKTITYAIIGLLVILFAKAIVLFITSLG
ncbi:hypothetical protein A3D11_02670 [Candidatus Peribacteria bacterium RIFCSPHIGHO2_02_FULL_49_16]|nr:MAG: hypothetical protein A2880_01890 [Candidatus Peribacteria bacterium RIFCSPHIGHO2_01_FULL_49_38]OGJ58498.1 MAG: hypothetical protein A3D11_02670 [Candidatus Peribacteria bacterium RIFCSPHIGHO2_02_FULL_49_16]